MIVERVTVRRLADGKVMVDSINQSYCVSCKARSGCGQHLFSKLLGRPSLLVLDVNPEDFERLVIGDQLEIGVPEVALLFLSFLTYMLPVVCMIVVAAISSAYIASDLWVAVVAFSALLLAGLFSSHIIQASRLRFALNPTLLRCVNNLYPAERLVEVRYSTK